MHGLAKSAYKLSAVKIKRKPLRRYRRLCEINMKITLKEIYIRSWTA
jgi:hypothetical protein